MKPQTIATGASENLNANEFTLTDYTFTGWNTESEGSGEIYENEAEFTMGTESVTNPAIKFVVRYNLALINNV